MNAALRIFLIWLGLTASARAQELLVIERAPADHAATERLAELHEEPAHVLQGSFDALAQARALGVQRAVIFDGPRVSVLDVESGEQVTRSTQDNTPYTAAFVAAELLALRPEPTPHFGVRVGVQLLAAPPFPVAARAELGLAFQDARWRGELYAATPARSTYQDIERSRTDLGLRATWFALQRERFRLGVGGQLGVAWVRAGLEELQTRTLFSAGVGVEPSLPLASWLALYALAVGQASTPRAEYRVANVAVARESPFGFAVSLGLWFTPPFF